MATANIHLHPVGRSILDELGRHVQPSGGMLFSRDRWAKTISAQSRLRTNSCEKVQTVYGISRLGGLAAGSLFVRVAKFEYSDRNGDHENAFEPHEPFRVIPS